MLANTLIRSFFFFVQYRIPDYFLNRQKDIKDGKFSQLVANQLDNKVSTSFLCIRCICNA